MHKGLKAKASIMKKYPDMGTFVIKAYYEKDPEICNDIQKDIRQKGVYKQNQKVVNLNPDVFKPGLDLEMMYRDMYLASEGYLWEKLQQDNIDVDEMEQDFVKMIEFWEKIYLRDEKKDGE